MADSEMYEPTRPVVVAKRISRCQVCGDRITTGEEITNADGAWVHLDCSDDLGDAA